MKTGRKFWAFIISLATLTVCAFFKLDVSIGVSTLFGLYVGSNVAQKATQKEIHDEQ